MALFWNSCRWPPSVRYGAAVGLVAAAVTCNYLLPPVYADSHYFFFSAAIMAAAFFGGLGPGLLATAVSAPVAAYFFIAPYYNIRIEEPEAAHRLAVFMMEGAIISTVAAVIRENRTPEISSALRRLGAGILLVLGATILKLIFFPALERHLPFTFFYSAVVGTAWVAGALPGLLATAASVFIVRYLFAETAGSHAPGSSGLLLFVLEASALCLLTAVFRQRLVETEAHLGRVFEDSPLGILILEEGGRIARANPTFLLLLGTEREHLEGRNLIDLTQPDSRERASAFVSGLLHEPSAVHAPEVCLVCGDSLAWANLHGSRIRESRDRKRTCLVMAEDITERRRAEEALRDTELRLQRGQRLEAIGMFAGGVAHDFNNLLSVIFASCEGLLYEGGEVSRQYAQEILQASKSAADLTRQLLTFARRQPGTPEVIDINRLLTDMAGLLQRLLGSRVKLDTELATDAGSVMAEPSQLQQVLMNLAANARDAMPTVGRLTIRTSRAGIGGDRVCMQVTDTGVGMDEATRSHVFEPLFSTKDLDKGTGLGLATVSSIVTKLGGSISVDSAPGKGACFSIELPAVVKEHDEPVEIAGRFRGR